jgi:putative ABC transport system permease protein
VNARLTGARLVARGIVESIGSLVIVAVISAIVAAMAVAGLAEQANILQQDLHYRLGTTSPEVRDLQSSTTVSYFTDAGIPVSVAGTVKKLPKFLASVRASMPSALRNITSAGRYVGRDAGTGNGIRASGPPTQPPDRNYSYSIEADPDLRLDAVLVAGSWPGRVRTDESLSPIQLVTTVSAAKTLDWKIGQVQAMALDGSQVTQPVVLVGTIRPRDADSDYWQVDPTRAHAGSITSTDGDTISYFGTVWMDAATWPVVSGEFSGQSITTWFPVTSSGLRFDQVSALGGDIQRFVSKPRTVGRGSANIQVRYIASLDDLLESYVARAGAGTAVLDVVEAGPIGTGAALLLLAVLSVVDRRRRITDLLRSRGASSRRFRFEMATHIAAATIPGAIIGGGIAVWATGGALGIAPLAAAATVAVLPPLFAAGASGAAPVVLARGGVAKPSRWRWVSDTILILLAVLAIFVLLQRGLTTSTGLGPDPLLTALPLVVSAAACAVVLRIVPFALRGLGRAIRRGRGVVGLVGRANSARAGARFLPVFAVLTGLSVSIFASSILTTEQTGIRAAAVEQAGADISISGSPISEATVSRLRALRGIENLAAIHSRGGALIEGQSQTIAIYTVNASDLVAVEGVLPADQQLFGKLGTRMSGRPVVYGGGFASPLHSVSRFSDSSASAIATIKVTRTPPKFIGAVPWLLMDSSAAPKDLHLASQVSAVLIRVSSGTDQVALQQRIARISGPSETVQVANTQVRTLTEAPLVAGLEFLMGAAIVLSFILCVLALMLALITGARERNQVLGRLRALGFSRRQATGLVGWEIGPMTLLGVVVGVVTGLGLPLVFLSVVNLTTFIGSTQPPEFETNPVLIGVIVLAFALSALVAVFATAALSARAATSVTLREAGD